MWILKRYVIDLFFKHVLNRLNGIAHIIIKCNHMASICIQRDANAELLHVVLTYLLDSEMHHCYGTANEIKI